MRLAAVVGRLATAAEWVSTLMFAGIFLVFLAGIVMRYVFGAPLAWGDELAMILLVWATFWLDAFVSRERDHVAFDALWNVASPRGRRIMGVAQGILFAGLFAAAFPTVLDYVLFLWRERTTALQWRLDAVYSCFVVYMAMVVVRLLAKLVALCGPDWRRHVASDEAPGVANVIG